MLNNNNPLKNILILFLKLTELNTPKKDSFSRMKSILLLKTEEAHTNKVYLTKWYFCLQIGRRLRLQRELTFPGSHSGLIDLDKSWNEDQERRSLQAQSWRPSA